MATKIPKSLPFNPKSFKYTGRTGITRPIPTNIKNILKYNVNNCFHEDHLSFIYN